MKIDIEEVSKTRRTFKIEVPSDIVSKEYSEAYDNLRKKSGCRFRQGKFINVIEQRFKRMWRRRYKNLSRITI